MSMKIRKVACQFYFDQLDDDGHLVAEPVVESLQDANGTRELIILYPHQFDGLADKAAELAGMLEAQTGDAQPDQITRLR